MVHRVLGGALCALVVPVLLGCSASSGDAGGRSDDGLVTGDAGTPSCSSSLDCASGEYCAASGRGCGSGTCVPSPQACPMISNPVCGCDGKTYLNACHATMGQPGSPGTTSSGSLYVTPTKDALVGTWSRVSRSGESETQETLVLASDATFSLTESTRSGGSSSALQVESAGTFAVTTVGLLLHATTSPAAVSLATEFYLENTCPIGGPLQLVGVEPPGDGATITLLGE